MHLVRSRFAAALLLALGAAAASAQPAPPPTTVGVSPATATEAEKKAVPRADTGTMVRTAPTAADRTRAAADKVTPPATATAPETPATATAPTPQERAPVRRATKADRN